jgi:uncharacterized protein YndB with AHSA1/START domain
MTLTVREPIDIPAPVADVFAYMDEPAHQPAITPSLTRSELVERLPNGGSRVRYTYRILGVSFSGEVRATDYVPDERIVWSMTGDLTGTLRWYFAPSADGAGTRFTYAATYALPGPALTRPLLAPLVRRYNEREVRTLLRTLRNRWTDRS